MAENTSSRMCFQWSTAPTLTRHWRLWFVNSSADWRSCCQYRTSNRPHPGSVLPPLCWRSICSVSQMERTLNFFSRANSATGNWLKVVLLRFSQMIFSFPLCLFPHRWKWPSLPTRVLVTMKIMTFLRSSCSMKNCRQTLPLQQIFPSHRKGLIIYRHLLAGDSRQGCINAPSVTNASSITLSSSSTRESTAGCSLTTAPNVGGLSEQPLCWPVTGCANAKMLHICALNVGTVFQPHWTNSDTTAQNGAATTTVGTAGRVFRSQAA